MKKVKEHSSGSQQAGTTKGYTGASVNASPQQGRTGLAEDQRNIAFGKVESGNIAHAGSARKSSTGKSGSGK